MTDLYLKLGEILSSILLYGDGVKSVGRPDFSNGIYRFTVSTEYGTKVIEIPVKTLNSVHDYKLHSYIIKLMEEEHLI